MVERYRWSDADIRLLRDKTQAVHDLLVEVSSLVSSLTAEMEAETTWAGEHKIAFMAWMDLVRQFHEQLASTVIGPAAVDSLNGFLNSWASYYQDSSVYTSLGRVQ